MGLPQQLVKLAVALFTIATWARIECLAATYSVNSFTLLKYYIETGASDGDVISIGADIDVTEQIQIDDDITIDGNGYTIDGGGNNRIFVVSNGAKVQFNDTTFNDGYSSVSAQCHMCLKTDTLVTQY